ncbi:hypothetical protein BH18ACT15_BH18ACT15_08070 [soil metagenome]
MKSSATPPGSAVVIPSTLRLVDTVAVSWRLYKARAGALLTISVPAMVVFWLLPVLPILVAAKGRSQALLFVLYVLAPTIGEAVVGAWAHGRCSIVMRSHLGDDEPRTEDQSEPSFTGIGRDFLLASVVIVPLAILALTAFYFMGFAVFYAIMGPPIVLQAIIFERKHIREAWTLTKQRLRGRWLTVIGYLLCFALTMLLFQTLLTSLVYGLLALAGASVTEASRVGQLTLFNLLQGLFAGLLLPFVVAAATALYWNARHAGPLEPRARGRAARRA